MSYDEPPDALPSPNSPEERHRRKCLVCNHPDRELIEDAFIDWGSPHAISSHYKLPDGSLRRHARAVGLYALRQGNLRAALDNVLERSSGAKVTGDTVTRAVRAYTCLTDDNKWVEPITRVLFSSHAGPLAIAPLGDTSQSPTALPPASRNLALGAGGDMPPDVKPHSPLATCHSPLPLIARAEIRK